jgi:hypothetical protein
MQCSQTTALNITHGKSEVPIFEAFDILHKDGYKGDFSFEWEKLWHPRRLTNRRLALADISESNDAAFQPV